MGERDWLLDELEDAERHAPRGKGRERGVWPFKRKRELTADEVTALENRARINHYRALEAELRSMAGDHWHSRSSGAIDGGVGTYERGLGEVLKAQKQRGRWGQAIAKAAAYGVSQGWLTPEQHGSLDLKPPEVEEVVEQRERERERRESWEAEFERILGDLPDGVSFGEARALWNKNRWCKGDDSALSKFERALKQLGGAKDGSEQSSSREQDQSWRKTFGRSKLGGDDGEQG